MVAVALEGLEEEMGLGGKAAGEDPAAQGTAEVHLPADINWEMLDKSKFFFLGAGLFSAVSAALYPAVVLKTRLQVSPSAAAASCYRAAAAILRHEGPRGFYRGFGTSIAGTVPARALYMGALEVTRSGVGAAAARLGASEPASAAIASAAAGVSAAMAAQVVWTPVDVVTQRLMVQGARYRGGVDAFRKILMADGLRGLYRGFGVSVLTYAPSSAVWWTSYSLSQRAIWGGVGWCLCCRGEGLTPGYGAVAAVQAASAAVAGGASALATMPLDTIKTRMQVLDGEEGGGGLWRTVRALVREGGWGACYRGLGPRWASMSTSAVTMVTTYELLKRLSAKTGTPT